MTERRESKNPVAATLDFLSSRTAALIVLAVLALLFLVGMVVPQESMLPPPALRAWRAGFPGGRLLQALGLTRIYSSPLFGAAAAFLMVSLTACSLRRLRVAVLKGGARRWGSVGFHSGMMLMGLGFLVTLLLGLQGQFQLHDGQRFTEGHGSYGVLWEGPLFSEKHLGWTIGLRRLDTAFRVSNYAPDLASTMEVIGPDGSIAAVSRVHLNSPLWISSMAVYQGTTYGPTPTLIIRVPDGTMYGQAVNLVYAAARGVSDTVTVPIRGASWKARLQMSGPPARDVKRGDQRSLPLPESLSIVLVENGRTLKSGRLRLGETMSSDGWDLRFAEVHRWSTYRVSYEPGSPLVIAGLAVSLIGLAAMYLPRLLS